MKRKVIPITGSILLHLCILLILVIHFKFFSHLPANNGKKNTKTLHTYLYQGQLNFTHTAQKITAIPLLKPIHKTEQATNPLALQVPLQGVAKPSEANDQAVDALISLLHSAIQAAQIYPESALSLQRSGRTTISFNLSPDGNSSEIKLVKSSGNGSLDNAALDAVRHASPFHGVDPYLTQTKNFQIDVVFELPEEMR